MVNFFNDIASEEDYLGYYPYIESFNYILVNNNDLITPPLVFGIHGKWGSGKTTFMNLIKNRIEKEKRFYTVEINPWEYGQTQNFITIFLAKLYQEVKGKVKFFGKNSGPDFIKSIFKPLKLSLDIKPVKAEYDFDKFSLDQQQSVINKLISENFALKESISYILDHDFISKKKIVIFIDDLDRCDVDKVMEVIESIKLVFNSKNCIFFLGCDINYLQSALSNKYENFIRFSKENYNELVNFDLSDFSREYLEKIIQIPFYIPTIDGKAIRKYVNSILESNKIQNKTIEPKENIYQNFKKDLKDDFISELIITTDVNPRRIKRILNLTFLNYVFMKFKNIEKNNLKINTKLLAFLCIIKEVYPVFYKETISHESSCRDTFVNFFEKYDEERKASEVYDKEEYIISGSSEKEKVKNKEIDESRINLNKDTNDLDE
ncbi:P-loop NTPase fold protein, partial [Clostridium sp. A1-XYC3]